MWTMTPSRKAGGTLTLTLYFTVYVDYDAVAESGRSPNPNPILYSLCGL